MTAITRGNHSRMTVPQDSPQRPLKWPLSLSGGDDEFTGEASESFISLVNWPVVDTTERINVIMNLSRDEYQAITNTVDVGRDIAYNDNSGQIWYIWLRMLQTMTICDDVANCIDTSQVVQDAITQYLIASGIINPNIINPDATTIDDRFPNAQRELNIKSAPAGCDKDILWAGCKEIAIRLDDNARQILEGLLVIVDTYERYVSLIGLIPIVGDLIKDLANQFTEVIPDIYNSFNAYSSAANIEALTCSLFELVCNDCEYPTFNQVANTIADNSFGALLSWETMSMTTVISQFVSTGSFTPTLVWHSMLLFELFTLYIGGKFGNATGAETLEQWALLGEDEPSADWELLCSGCGGEWCYNVPLDEMLHFDWSSASGNQYAGTYSGGVWSASLITAFSNKITAIGVYYTLPTNVAISRVECDIAGTAGSSPNQTPISARVRASDGINWAWDTIDNYNPDFAGTPKTVSMATGSILTIDNFRFYQVVDNTTGTPSGNGSLSAIRIYGTGTPPAWANNC